MSPGANFHHTVDALRGQETQYFTHVAPALACGNCSIPFNPSVLIETTGPFWSPDPLLRSDEPSPLNADNAITSPLGMLALAWRRDTVHAFSSKLNWESIAARTSREIGTAIAFMIGLDVLSSFVNPAAAAPALEGGHDHFGANAALHGDGDRLQTDATLPVGSEQVSREAAEAAATTFARTSLDPTSTSQGFEKASWEGEGEAGGEGHRSTQSYVPLAIEPAGFHEQALPDGTERGADNSQGQLIASGDGNDHLKGGAGNDTLVGGDGDDWLDGGAGSDLMIGGSGNDTYRVDDVGDVVTEDAAGGIDTVETTLASYHLGDEVENLVGLAPGNFEGVGNSLDNYLAGAGGDDFLDGGAGSDTLASGGGNDTLVGGSGADVMIGGKGDDLYVVDSVGDIVNEAADSGTDTIVTTLNAYSLGDTLENLVFAGDGDFVGEGNSSNNSISGGGGNDELFGDWEAAVANGRQVLSQAALSELLDGEAEIIVLKGDGQISDGLDGAGGVVVGSRQNDTIVGVLGGNDSISGGFGNDTIDGGAGNDVLSGGWGNDVFVFRPGFGTDIITDFGNRGGDFDVIRLSSFGFTSFEEVESHISQVGSDTVLELSETETIVLAGVDKMTLALEDQFIF